MAYDGSRITDHDIWIASLRVGGESRFDEEASF